MCHAPVPHFTFAGAAFGFLRNLTAARPRRRDVCLLGCLVEHWPDLLVVRGKFPHRRLFLQTSTLDPKEVLGPCDAHKVAYPAKSVKILYGLPSRVTLNSDARLPHAGYGRQVQRLKWEFHSQTRPVFFARPKKTGQKMAPLLFAPLSPIASVHLQRQTRRSIQTLSLPHTAVSVARPDVWHRLRQLGDIRCSRGGG